MRYFVYEALDWGTKIREIITSICDPPWENVP